MALQFSRRRVLVALGALSVPALAACGGAASPTVAPTQPAAPAATTAPATGATKPAAAGTPAAGGATPTTGGTPAAAGTPAAGGTPAPSTKAGTPAAATKAGASGTLTIAELGALSKTMHPYPDDSSYTSTWQDVARSIWNGALLDFDANTLEYVPDMAQSYQVSDDGKVFTFTLRDNMKWSDGQPITVDDFLYAYEQAKNPDNAYVGLEDVQRIVSMTSPNATTLVVTLDETYARDVATATANGVGPVPSHIWRGKPWNDPQANPEILNPTVVLGPYRVKEFRQAEQGVFEAITTHYAGTPNIPEIIRKPAQQPTVVYEMIRTNQAQWAPDVPPSQYAEAKRNPDVNVLEWTAANSAYRLLQFNLARPVLADMRVREAIARVINRQDLIEVAENGLGSPQFSFLNPANTRWYNPNVEKFDFDMNRAKSLLQEAGYTLNGNTLQGADGQPVRLTVYWPTTSAPRGKIATYMQQQLRQIGIELDVRGLDFNAYTDQISVRKDYDLALGTYGGGTIDPDVSKSLYLSDGQQNTQGYSNERVDTLFRSAATEQDNNRRKQMYDEIQMMVVSDLPSHYLYALVSWSVVSKRVQGMQPNKLDALDANRAFMKWSVQA